MRSPWRPPILPGLSLLGITPSGGLLAATLHIGFIGQEPPDLRPATYNLEPSYRDVGLRGAELGIRDNNTTGRFLDQRFALLAAVVGRDEDPLPYLSYLLKEGVRFIVLNLSAEKLLRAADLAGEGALLFNAGAYDDQLRNRECRENLLHTIPSYAMLADALGQYLKKKGWNRWFLVAGDLPEDRKWLAALKRTASRFKFELVEEKRWAFGFDVRRVSQSLVHRFTQGRDYDILIVADAWERFAPYFPYRTYRPRPVGGSARLIATAWHPAHEQWGAVQLQNRFRRLAGRSMKPKDYAAWLAVRAIGEAATRTRSLDFGTVKRFLLTPEFKLAGFKGRPLSFRPWSGQMRQPILVTGPRSVVAVAPLPEFLHPEEELDSLGYDRRESGCTLERGGGREE